MLRKRAAHQKKVDSAVRVLQTTTGVKVPWAMILAGFSKSDSADEIVHQQVRRRLALMGGADNNQRKAIFVDVDNTPSLSDFMKKSIFASMKKITQLLLAIILLAIRHLLPPYLRCRPPPSRRAFITLPSLALRHPPTALVPCRRPPPPSRRIVPRPCLSRLIVSIVGRRGQRHRRILCRRAGGGGRSHPSSSSSVATTTLRVARPPP
jgi:hypothetical protein